MPGYTCNTGYYVAPAPTYCARMLVLSFKCFPGEAGSSLGGTSLLYRAFVCSLRTRSCTNIDRLMRL
jgi:hypothetical protein